MTNNTVAETKPDSGENSGEQPKQVVNKPFIVAQWRLIVILLLIIALAGMYVWKNVASPVMGLSTKVGVLILLYTPASYNLQAP